jgi:hypothetical protein
MPEAKKPPRRKQRERSSENFSGLGGLSLLDTTRKVLRSRRPGTALSFGPAREFSVIRRGRKFLFSSGKGSFPGNAPRRAGIFWHVTSMSRAICGISRGLNGIGRRWRASCTESVVGGAPSGGGHSVVPPETMHFSAIPSKTETDTDVLAAEPHQGESRCGEGDRGA